MVDPFIKEEVIEVSQLEGTKMEVIVVDHVEEKKLSQFIKKEIIEADQLEETNNGGLS